MLSLIAKKIFGTRNDRILESLAPLVNKVNDLEKNYTGISDDELRNHTAIFKQRLANGESLDSIQAEAFAVMREASKRTIGLRHFDVQLIGGAILNSGKIAEMRTGEGKTLVATLPAYLNALEGKGVHVVTVNDYLARRDSEWMGQVYNALGMNVGVVLPNQSESIKRAAYAADITYGQNNEFGFDYLRDNMKYSREAMMQRGHHYAIVDEVDSILIDEARTPLIISGPAEDSADLYANVNSILPHLKKDEDFQTDLRTKQPTLTEAGVAACEKLLRIDNLYDPSNLETLHHVTNALKAHTVMERDVDYVVREGKVIIVDEFTGRLMDGRRWSNGLHQAVEAKEGVKIQRENQTLASITFQNYFRMYKKLSGMTGTADTEAVEFNTIYKLEVIVIPTNLPMKREDETDRVFRTRPEKYKAVATDIVEISKTGQPVLVGTISIEQSESLSKMLTAQNIKHDVLNAKQHEREADIVAQAGRFGGVTIATNMAGRGTDIVLGGNPQSLAASEAGTRDPADPKFKEALEKFKASCAEEKQRVLAAGGLFIMGTERHESRRIDNQLRGRSGRQGDPGHSRFYVSLEDDLMQRFGGDKIKHIMNRLGWEEGVAIDGRLISRSIETAQKRVEAYHFEARKHVTEYDDVMNKQRQVVYSLRNRILDAGQVEVQMKEMLGDLMEVSVMLECDEKVKPMQWDLKKVSERASFLVNQEVSIPENMELSHQAIFDVLNTEITTRYEQKRQDILSKLGSINDALKEATPEGENSLEVDLAVEQQILLETMDTLWNQHLQTMDELREGIGLRGYGQKNPLYEYQREGFELFQQFLLNFKEQVVRRFFFYEAPSPQQFMAHIQAEQQRREEMTQRMQLVHEGDEELENEQDGGKSSSAERDRLAQQKKERRKMR